MSWPLTNLSSTTIWTAVKICAATTSTSPVMSWPMPLSPPPPLGALTKLETPTTIVPPNTVKRPIQWKPHCLTEKDARARLSCADSVAQMDRRRRGFASVRYKWQARGSRVTTRLTQSAHLSCVASLRVRVHAVTPGQCGGGVAPRCACAFAKGARARILALLDCRREPARQSGVSPHASQA
eukprot:183292-Pleurochrysis_carterae.AAC.6